MSEFFRGWKRKVGVVTLLMACLSTAGWVRSRGVCDLVSVYRTDALFRFMSSGGYLGWFDHRQGIDTSRLKTMPFPSWRMRLLADHPDEFESTAITWKIRCLGFGIGDCSGRTTSVLRVPYWSFTVPLTLISLWLLLSKPRTSNQKKIAESTANSGM